jgi:hypothetical protein
VILGRLNIHIPDFGIVSDTKIIVDTPNYDFIPVKLHGGSNRPLQFGVGVIAVTFGSKFAQRAGSSFKLIKKIHKYVIFPAFGY